MTTWLAFFLLGVFALDRLLKHLAVTVFFRRPPPPPSTPWPALSLIQPITHSPNDLRAVLRARAQLAYPAACQHLLIYDAPDALSLAVIEHVCRDFPHWQPAVIPVQQAGQTIASKVFKMNAGLSAATGEVICFVDDDVLLPPTALQTLTAHLAQPGLGAVFGLASYTNWRTPWAALMSAFVNGNALLSYIPFTFFIEPFTITGHCYALRRADFESIGGVADLQENFGDDHELARRIRRLGLRLGQTPMVYGVDNALASWSRYQAQMKRWFVFPRQMMWPYMSRTEQTALFLGTSANLIPGGLAVLAMVSAQPSVWLIWLMCLGLFALVYAVEERQFLPHRTPLARWPLVLASAFLAPAQVLWALLSNDVIEWRGQRVRILRGGRYERL